nr:reverse transcriptase domain-containing protein [Tanacetum cinerariifolium]
MKPEKGLVNRTDWLGLTRGFVLLAFLTRNTCIIMFKNFCSPHKFILTVAPSVGPGIPIYPKKKTEKGTVGSQPIEEGTRGTEARDVGKETHVGSTEPVSQIQKTFSPSLAFIIENIKVLRTMIKEHDQQAKKKATPKRLACADSDKEAPIGQRTPSKNKEPSHQRWSRRLEDRSRTKEKVGRSKSRGKRSGHQETSSDSEYEEGSEDTYEDLNPPYKRPKPTPFTQRITRFKYHQREKLLGNIRVLHISAFMHGHGHLKLAKKLNDKIPKTVKEMLERFRAFIGGEVVAGSAEMIEKAVALGKLAHLVKDIHQNNQRNMSHGRNNVKVINIVRGGRNSKRPFEGERSGLTDELTFLAIPHNRLTDEPIILEGMIEHQENIPPFGDNRPLSNYGRGRKKQNDVDGVRDCKMSFAVQHHNKKDRNEKPRSEEAKGSVVKKFFGKGEQVQETPDASEGETSKLSKNLQAKLTPSTKGLEVIPRERSNRRSKGMKDLHILIDSLTLVSQIEGNHTPVTEQERKYKEKNMDATAPFHRFQITHLPKILNTKTKVLTRLAIVKLEFLSQEVSVEIKTRPSIKVERPSPKVQVKKPNYD